MDSTELISIYFFWKLANSIPKVFDEDQELLNQLMAGMAPETRHRMQWFVRLVAVAAT